MSKKNKKNKKNRFKKRVTNPDFRRRTDFPLPPVEEIEKRLMAVLSPGAFAPLRMADQRQKLRERILVLPVMTAIVVSLVWRKIPSLAETLRILAREGLLWVEAGIKVSRQALSKRLERLPAGIFAQLFNEVIYIIHQEGQNSPLPQRKEKEFWLKIKEHFGVIWIADGSTMEALKKKLKAAFEAGTILGGKMMMIVEALTHLPIAAFYSEDSKVNDKSFSDKLLEKLPVGGLLVFDLGFFSFLMFDSFTEAKKFFITRLRNKTSYKVVALLSQGPRFRDSIIEVGRYRSNPCQYRLRLVEVLWNGTWYRYLSNVLDSQILSAKEICELYRSRWRIEDAFNLTKRLLGLAYLWVGKSNGIQIQIYATWIFYAVLNDICQQVAIVLNQPLERISVEMVFRGFYHFSRAFQKGESDNIALFLAEHSVLLGIVKATRKRHRQAKIQEQEIWGGVLS